MNTETIKKNLPILVIVILAIAAIAYFLSGMGAKNENNTIINKTSTLNTTNSKAISSNSAISSTTNTTTSNTPVELKVFDKAEISAHADISSCWVTFKGEVFDVTPYISMHPGGEAILEACSHDLDEHNHNHPGGPFDSPQVQAQLKPLKIGVLK